MTNQRILACLLGAALAPGGPLAAQNPEDPPPWWRVQDNDTVSVFWNFDNAAQPYTPNLVVAPNWFTGATIMPSATIRQLAQVTNHQGVVGFSGAASGTLDVMVDNDPRPDWVKVFWMQYDAHATATGTVTGEIRQRLQAYARHNVHEKSRDLGQGWRRVTLQATLAPQPDDENMLLSLMEGGAGTVAIDNLYTSTRCIKPEPDGSGDGLGSPTGTSIDLFAATQNNNCFGVARTLIGNQERFWVTARGFAPGSPHLLYSFDRSGQLLATFNQPTRVNQPSATGMLDLAVVPGPAGPLLFGGQDGAGGVPTLFAFDVQAGAFVPALTITINGLPPGTVPRALCFNPDGRGGAGTFWLSDLGGQAFEVDRQGTVLLAIQTGAVQVAAAAYDRFVGMLYWFGRGGSQDPRNVQVVGSETSAFDLRPTGVRFYGDLSVAPQPGGGPGGSANGMEFYRLANGEGRLVCLADAASDTLYELHAPFRFGYSCAGTIGMAGGVPYRGNANWSLTLSGVPGATFASAILGFSNTMHGGLALPAPMTSFGLPECSLLVSIQSTTGFVPVTAAGTASVPVPIPLTPSFAYANTYWQWVVLDPSAQPGLAMSAGGKTVLY